MNTAAGRIRVAHVIFRLDVGGLENGLVNLVNALPANRFEHAIVCIDRSTEYRNRIRNVDVRVDEIRRQPGRDFGAPLRIYKVLREIQPQIVHTRNLPALDALPPAFAAGIRIRVHGEHGRNIDDALGTKWKYRALRRMYAPFVTRYVALSKETESYLTNKVGIRENRISQIYNGVDTERFAPTSDRAASRHAAGLPFGENDFVFGFVGRLDPVKNLQLLLDAFAQQERNPASGTGVKLAIIGDGPVRQQLEASITARGLARHCWIAGERGDVPTLMRSLNAFVLPSFVEGISNTLLEAMATGLPVIATDVGGNAELIGASDCGILIRSGDLIGMSQALSAYLHDPLLCTAHGQNARKRAASNFSIQTMVDSYRALYESLVERYA